MACGPCDPRLQGRGHVPAGQSAHALRAVPPGLHSDCMWLPLPARPIGIYQQDAAWQAFKSMACNVPLLSVH